MAHSVNAQCEICLREFKAFKICSLTGDGAQGTVFAECSYHRAWSELTAHIDIGSFSEWAAIRKTWKRPAPSQKSLAAAISSHQQWLLLSLPSLHISAPLSPDDSLLKVLRNARSVLLSVAQPQTSQIELGYSITLTLAPKVFGGRLCLNFARTTPEFPCGLVTFPHITLIFDPCRSFEAR